MKFTIKTEKPAAVKCGCVVIGIHERRKLSSAAQAFDKTTRGLLTRLMSDGEMDGRAGQTLMVSYPAGAKCTRVLLVGCGKENKLDRQGFRRIIAHAVSAVNKSGATDAISFLADLNVTDSDVYWKVRQTVEVTSGSLHKTGELKTKNKKATRLLRRLGINVTAHNEAVARTAMTDGEALAGGIELARKLGDMPANLCTPSHLASQAREIGKTYKKVKTTVLEEAAMKKLGMGALLSVSRGSRQPAKLITLEYSGGQPGDKPVVLVGKGVTFDSGGISIKPSPAMDEMKYDMCGAASVLGTVQACAEMDLPLNVVGVIPSTENLPDGDASKPGDVVTSMSGQTIEVLNTDAEGRLILCDALTYSDKFSPAVVIDIATLTGACVVALGAHATGLLSNDDELADELLDAGITAADRAWHLPLWDEYQKQIDTNFADIANVGGRGAGTITAACFLSRFTSKYRWAHLDIAGVAWKHGHDKGATGRPVALLTQFLLNRSNA